MEERVNGGVEANMDKSNNKSKKASRLSRTKEKKKSKKQKSTENTTDHEWDSLEMTIPEPFMLKSQASLSPQAFASFKAVNLEKWVDTVPINAVKDEINDQSETYSQIENTRKTPPAQLEGQVASDTDLTMQGGYLKFGQDQVTEEDNIDVRPKMDYFHGGNMNPKRQTVKNVKAKHSEIEAEGSNEYLAAEDENLPIQDQERAIEGLETNQMSPTRSHGRHSSEPSGFEDESRLDASKISRTYLKDLEVADETVRLAGDNRSDSPPETRVKLKRRRVKSKKSRRSASQVETEPELDFQHDLTPRELEENDGTSPQLLTPEASRPTLTSQLPETTFAALSHLNESLSLQEPQQQSASLDLSQFESSANEEPVSTGQQPQTKQRRKARKVAEEPSEAVLRNRRRRNSNEIGLDFLKYKEASETEEHVFRDIVPIDVAHDHPEVNQFSSPPPVIRTDDKLMSAFDNPKTPTDPQTHESLNIETHPLLSVDDQSQDLTPVVGKDAQYQSQANNNSRSPSVDHDEALLQQLDTGLQESARLVSRRKQDMAEDETPYGDHPANPTSTRIRDRMRYAVSPPPTLASRNEVQGHLSAKKLAEPPANSGSWNAVHSDLDTEEPVVPMIGIYTNINGVFHRKEMLSAGSLPLSGKENSEFSDAIESSSDQAFELLKSERKKRRAPTDHESVFDLELLEERPKRRKKRPTLQPKAPLATIPFTPKPSRPSSSAKSPTAKSTRALARSASKFSHTLPSTPQSAQLNFADSTSGPTTTYDPLTPWFPTGGEELTSEVELSTAKSLIGQQHSIKSSSTRQSSSKSARRSKIGSERNANKSDGPQVKGKFSDKEIADIANEMVRYREAHDMHEMQLNQLVQDNATTGGELWNQLCETLPGRSRQAIIKICRRRYHNYGVRGKWTAEEDQELKEAYITYPNSWKKIGILLNRHPEDARDRWRNYLICGDNQKKDVWTDDEEEALRLAILECLEAIKEIRELEALKGRSNNQAPKNDMDLIDWQIVSAKLNHTRSRLQCMTKWKSLRERENSDNGEAKDLELGANSWRVRDAGKAIREMGSDEKLELLHAIQQSRVGREGKVPFRSLGSAKFQTKWSCMARKVAWKKMRATVPGNGDMKLQDIVTILIDEMTGNRDYATHEQDTLNESSAIGRKSDTVQLLSTSERLQNDAHIFSGDELEDNLHRGQYNRVDESRKVTKKQKHSNSFTGQQRRSPNPNPSDDIHSTNREMYAEEDAIQESDSPSIPESIVHNQLQTSNQVRYKRRLAPSSPDYNRKSKKPRKMYNVHKSSDEDDAEDIPARRPLMQSRSESLEL